MARPQTTRACSAKPRPARAECGANLRCSTALRRCVARRNSSSPRTKPAEDNAKTNAKGDKNKRVCAARYGHKHSAEYVQNACGNAAEKYALRPPKTIRQRYVHGFGTLCSRSKHNCEHNYLRTSDTSRVPCFQHVGNGRFHVSRKSDYAS